MNKTHFLRTVIILVGLGIANVSYGDGGMMSVTPIAQPITTASITEPSSAELIPLLSDLASVYSRLLAQTVGVPAPEYEDEGFLTVSVNDTMVFPCEEEGVLGTTCVRHLSQTLDESIVDLSSVPGFVYNDKFSYALTLVRTRAPEAVEEPYTFNLVHFTEVEYEG